MGQPRDKKRAENRTGTHRRVPVNRRDRRRARQRGPADNRPTPGFLDDAQGATILGGCDTCDAYQTVDGPRDRLYLIRVHHDDWCPTYRAMKGLP